MDLKLNNFLKKHPFFYIFLKYNINSFKIFKLYNSLKNLGLINKEKYLEMHNTENCNFNPILHYIFFSSKNDSIELKKQYICPLFDLDVYKNKFLEDSDEDPIIHYCSNGFFNNYPINYLDEGYVVNLNENVEIQIKRGTKKRIEKELKNSHYIMEKNVTVPYVQSEELYDTDTIKVGIFFNDPIERLTACPYLRIHEPFKKLSESKKFHFFVYGMDSYGFMDINNIINAKVFDIIIVERILPFLDILLNKSAGRGIKFVYETDDDLLAIEGSNSSFEYINRCRNEITQYINQSDNIVVTTPTLAKKFDENKVEIIRNYYVDTILPLKNFRDNITNTIKIGYFGTLTHSNDLNIIKKVIIRLKKELSENYNINLEFFVVGGFADPNQNESWFSKIELPENSWDFEFFMKWVGDIADWDIGIAPLENNDFNRGKSELKYIEYSALGIPTVCSRVEPYSLVIKEGVTGFLAESEEEWFEKLKNLILNNDLRKEIVKNSQKNILEDYSLIDRVKQWENLLEKLQK